MTLTWRDMINNPSLTLPKDLPLQIPLLDICGAVLLPKGQLPIVLERRHASAIKKAMGTNRLVGVVQNRSERGLHSTPSLFQFGCLGKISALSEAEHGKDLVVITGLTRFRVLACLDSPQEGQNAPENVFFSDRSEGALHKSDCPTGRQRRESFKNLKKYRSLDTGREIKVTYEPFAFDRIDHCENVEDREGFLELVRGYCCLHDIVPDWEEVVKANDESLVTSLAMMCPFTPPERQALLEVPTLKAREKMMTALMEVACLKGGHSRSHLH